MRARGGSVMWWVSVAACAAVLLPLWGYYLGSYASRGVERREAADPTAFATAASMYHPLPARPWDDAARRLVAELDAVLADGSDLASIPAMDRLAALEAYAAAPELRAAIARWAVACAVSSAQGEPSLPADPLEAAYAESQAQVAAAEKAQQAAWAAHHACEARLEALVADPAAAPSDVAAARSAEEAAAEALSKAGEGQLRALARQAELSERRSEVAREQAERRLAAAAKGEGEAPAEGEAAPALPWTGDRDGDPGDVHAWMRSARDDLKAGRLADAIRVLDRAVRAQRRNHGARNDLALALLHADRDVAALAHLETLRRMDSGYVPAQLNLTVLLERFGRGDEAQALAEEAARTWPAFPEVAYNAAWYRQARGDAAGAERLLAPIIATGGLSDKRFAELMTIITAQVAPTHDPSRPEFWREGLIDRLGDGVGLHLVAGLAVLAASLTLAGFATRWRWTERIPAVGVLTVLAGTAALCLLSWGLPDHERGTGMVLTLFLTLAGGVYVYNDGDR